MFPDFLNTLPAEWKVLPVSEACAFTAKPRSLDFGKYQELAFVPMDLIPTGRLHFSNFILKSPSEVTSGTYFEEGDLLVSKITPCFENGKQGIAHAIPNGFGIATTEVIPLKPRDGLTHLPFIAYYLLHHEVRHLIAAAMEGATGRQRLPKDLLAQWPVPIPPIDEQRAIARLLETIQTAAQVEAAICDKLAALKSATMAKLFREGLRGEPLKQTEIGEIPESWDVVRLGDVARVTTGTTPSTDEPEYYTGDIPFVKTAEIDGQIITDSAVHVSQKAVRDYRLRLYPPGTVFVAMYGQGKTRGRSAILGVAATTTQNTAAIECFDQLVPTYLWNWLDSRYDDLRGMGNLGHLSHLNLGYVKDLLIPLPSVSEQEEIGSAIDLIRRRLQVAKDRGRILDRLFRAMLASLMTGAIRVKDLDLAEVSHA